VGLVSWSPEIIPECPSAAKERVVLSVDIFDSAGMSCFNFVLWRQSNTGVNDGDTPVSRGSNNDSTAAELCVPL
jgi:hypothetical protein